jgi:hypothetical protein
MDGHLPVVGPVDIKIIELPFHAKIGLFELEYVLAIGGYFGYEDNLADSTVSFRE